MDLELDTLEKPARGASERVEVWFLPEYYSDNQNAGKYHPGVPRRKIGQLNDTGDLEGTVRKLVNAPGAYYAAHIIGRDTIANGVFELKPKGQSLVIESPQSSAGVQATPVIQLQPTPQAEPSSAQSINATTETIRATKELLKEVQPPATAPPSVTKEDIAQMIEQAVTKATAQPAKPEAAPDPLQSLVSTVGVLKQLGVIPERKESTDAPDPTESFLSTYERFLDISTRINPEGKAQEGWFNKTVDGVKAIADAAPKVISSVAPIVSKAMSMRAAVQGQQEQTSTTPTAAPQQTDESLAQAEAMRELFAPVNSVLEVIAEGVLNYQVDPEDTEISEEAARAGDAVIDLCDQDETYQGIMLSVIQQPPLEIVKIIAGEKELRLELFGTETPMRLQGYGFIKRKKDAADFFKEMKSYINDTLTARAEAAPQNGLDVAPVGNNGHKTAEVAG